MCKTEALCHVQSHKQGSEVSFKGPSTAVVTYCNIFFFFFFLLFCFKIVSITTKHAEDTVTLLLDHTSYLLRQAYKYLSSGYGVDRKICHEGQGTRGLPSDADQ